MDHARRRRFAIGVVAATVALSHGRGVWADGFPGYQYLHAFNLPAGASVFDVLNDGRLIVLVGADVYVEAAAGSHSFNRMGTLPAADLPSFGAAFIRVSPTGTKIAIGNNGGASFSNYQVGIFDVDTLAGVWFVAGHFDGEWIDNTRVALTAGDFGSPSVVTVLDITSPNPLSPVNTTIVDNIGGASGGIAFDSAGNLYTGNGFRSTGPSSTGAVKAFANAVWIAALGGGPPVDFEADGVLIVDVLSASPLAFDGNGNLIVGGGDFSSSADFDFVALVRASAVADALAGMGPADPENPHEVWRIDPEKANDFNFFSATYDPTLGRLYVRDGGGPVHSYVDVSTIPTVSQWGLTSMTLLLMTAGTLIIRRSHVGGGV